MLKLLNEAYRIEHLRGEHLPKLSVLDRLVIMLSYYCDYRTMENIVFEYGVAKSTICECVKWVENILIKSEEFFLPQKKGTCQGHWDRSRAYFSKDVLLISGKRYIGMDKIHGNSLVPKKSTKKHKLTKKDKKYNSIISRRRIYIEHVNRHIKKFRIVSIHYRNKRRKFTLRFLLIWSV